MADPIQAQQVYEAQRDLRPLHREQEEAAARQRLTSGVVDSQRQNKVRRGYNREDINLFRRDNSRYSSAVRLFCLRLAARAFVTHLHNGENRETH